MKKALINEEKVVQVSDEEFQIAEPLYWVDCVDGCKVGWEMADGVASPVVALLPTVGERFTALKTDFLTYLTDHYDMGTQATMQARYVSSETPPETKQKIEEAWAWIRTVQLYYLEKKVAVLEGNVDTEWDFSQFDTPKPVWDWEDFV